jgi:hypothetical protein
MDVLPKASALVQHPQTGERVQLMETIGCVAGAWGRVVWPRSMLVNDKKIGEGRIEKTIPARYLLDETFDAEMDTGSPVSADYESPFPFAGTLKKVDIDVALANLSTSDREMLRQAAQDCDMAGRVTI